jgi:hypothetical protein
VGEAQFFLSLRGGHIFFYSLWEGGCGFLLSFVSFLRRKICAARYRRRGLPRLFWCSGSVDVHAVAGVPSSIFSFAFERGRDGALAQTWTWTRDGVRTFFSPLSFLFSTAGKEHKRLVLTPTGLRMCGVSRRLVLSYRAHYFFAFLLRTGPCVVSSYGYLLCNGLRCICPIGIPYNLLLRTIARNSLVPDVICT